jgi:hypothetical protein
MDIRHLGRDDDSLSIWKYSRSRKLRVEWRGLFALFSGIGELESRQPAGCSPIASGLELVTVPVVEYWTSRLEKMPV